jgi:DNA-binding CsgD family transcriptional regulator
MISNDTGISSDRLDSLPCFITPSDWQYIVHTLQFSPQQARIVSMILQKKQDKQISVDLKLNRSTIRTYLRRVFDRVGVDDRMELVLHVFALCLRRRGKRGGALMTSNLNTGPRKRRIKLGQIVSGSLSTVELAEESSLVR